MIRVVVDTNVFVAAILSPSGAPNAILTAIQDGRVEAVTCPALIAELDRALRYPKVARLRAGVAPIAVVTSVRSICYEDQDPPSIEPISRDPADDVVIALARQSGAHAIVTGDRDVLSLPGLDPPAISPRAFLDALEG